MSPTKKHFTLEQIEQARSKNLCELLESLGESVKKAGTEYEWMHGCEKVTIRGGLWYNQYEGKGGNAIQFVQTFLGKPFIEAVAYLLGEDAEVSFTPSSYVPKRKPKGEFILPKANDNMRRAMTYLTEQRGIPQKIVNEFVIKKMLYEAAYYHSAVFVGFDKDGVPRHASIRSTGRNSFFKGNAPNSSPEHSFNLRGKDDTIYLFESPIDMLSYIAMHQDGWQRHSYAAACGVSDRVLFQMLSDNPNLTNVKICFDSDQPGQTAAGHISDKLFVKGIKSKILVPHLKDWNEDLLFSDQNESEDEEPCMELRYS